MRRDVWIHVSVWMHWDVGMRRDVEVCVHVWLHVPMHMGRHKVAGVSVSRHCMALGCTSHLTDACLLATLAGQQALESVCLMAGSGP